MKNIPAHVTSALSGVVGLIALIHPGFHISPTVEQIVVICATALIAVLQSLHIHTSGKVYVALADERKVVNAVLANKDVVPAPVVEAAKDVQTIDTAIGASMSDPVATVSTPAGTVTAPVGSPDQHL